MKTKYKMVIIVQGGMVQEIYTNSDVEVVIVDNDNRKIGENAISTMTTNTLASMDEEIQDVIIATL